MPCNVLYIDHFDIRLRTNITQSMLMLQLMKISKRKKNKTITKLKKKKKAILTKIITKTPQITLIRTIIRNWIFTSNWLKKSARLDKRSTNDFSSTRYLISLTYISISVIICRYRFNAKCKNIVFIRIADDRIDPRDFLEKIFADLKEGGHPRTRFTNKVFPILKTCHAGKDTIANAAKELITANFSNAEKPLRVRN